MGFEVIKPGLLSTLQDEGRYGYRKYGVIVAGPMDRFAHRTANLLVGNGYEAVALEMTLSGPTLVAQSDRLVAICGADMEAKVDGSLAPLWQPFVLRTGSELQFQYAVEGCRAYLAVHGGFMAAEALGSHSTYLRAGMGGYEGRTLRVGDVLKMEKDESPIQLINAVDLRARSVSPRIRPDYRDNLVVRIVKGKEASYFTPESWSQLLSQSFQVTSQSDRMGYRLSSERKLALTEGISYEMISEAVACGTIQVPSSGQPIVLLADCQTTGGYPHIGHVISADLPLVAQIKPGGMLQFQEVTHREAQEQLLLQAMDLKLLEIGMQTWFRGLKK
ncbi:biotin-dependent carboxyltransferase family protein [Paenibacillus qinlingensis]|uniref:Antagonist of KipI n=1 Tax=Paenibacillus qinlingensis TaxID=1837343 RepID=A0ABU1P4C3_9BACL|nr:biotin-dependent carboxyltransferase family protein [Paenibacillus qinlingensis]MDR6554595.1 antagonist of KipI [Paenibacillus qinlingensis]